MNLLNRLERSDHDLELDDLAVLVKAYELGGVDRDTVESRHEFENGIVLANDLTNVAEISLAFFSSLTEASAPDWPGSTLKAATK